MIRSKGDGATDGVGDNELVLQLRRGSGMPIVCPEMPQEGCGYLPAPFGGVAR
jgi:hypothetical protein